MQSVRELFVDRIKNMPVQWKVLFHLEWNLIFELKKLRPGVILFSSNYDFWASSLQIKYCGSKSY